MPRHCSVDKTKTTRPMCTIFVVWRRSFGSNKNVQPHRSRTPSVAKTTASMQRSSNSKEMRGHIDQGLRPRQELPHLCSAVPIRKKNVRPHRSRIPSAAKTTAPMQRSSDSNKNVRPHRSRIPSATKTTASMQRSSDSKKCVAT